MGYSLVGQIYLFSKLGILKTKKEEFEKLTKTIETNVKKFGVKTNNIVKNIAVLTKNHSVWFAAAEHLSGNAHIAANQMNENAKRFAGYFLLPELNHHLLEGMINPSSNKKNVLFVMLRSELYSDKIKKRFALTEEILKKNKIRVVSVKAQGADKILQVGEVLVASSYLSFYSAMVENIDPTAIPVVDFFKKKLV